MFIFPLCFRMRPFFSSTFLRYTYLWFICCRKVFEEMKRYDVKPNGQTFVCLLNACAVSGQLDLV